MQCGLLLSMYMDSKCYTIMYNDNNDMYHEQGMNYITLVILS